MEITTDIALRGSAWDVAIDALAPLFKPRAQYSIYMLSLSIGIMYDRELSYMFERSEDKKQTHRSPIEFVFPEKKQYISFNPHISFEGKLFVFSGPFMSWEEKEQTIVKKVIAKGGLYRKHVSGVTNYLVVFPGYTMSAKVRAAIEQINKGKNVVIVMVEDLEKAL